MVRRVRMYVRGGERMVGEKYTVGVKETEEG